MFIFRLFRDIIKNGPIKGWKMQDSFSKWLILTLIAILLYKPITNTLGMF